ncbi:peptidoglycan binding domain-containing protein [Patescibacteria group bacterium]|nr:peptidoglycan binding domain-containing protein [Patescibacteria group bacterium]
MKKKMQAYKNWFNWLILALIGFFCLIYLGYHLAYWQKIYPGVKILNQPVGNKTVKEASLFLEYYLVSQNQPEFLSLFSGGQQWTLDLKEINFFYDSSLTSQKAYQIGRTGHAWGDFQAKIKIWFQGKNLSMDYSLETKTLEERMDNLATQIFIPAVEPTISLDKSQTKEPSRITIEQGKDGQEVDRRKFLGMINQQLAWADFNPIEIPIIKVSPLLTSQQMEETKKRAEKFLGKKITLTTSENRWELDENDLIGFLSFTNGFDQDKIASWSGN